MSTINQAIQEAIRANLPGQVADELQAFLQNAKEVESQLAGHKVRLQEVTDQLRASQAKLREHSEIDTRMRAADDREKALNAKELELIKKEAAIEAAVAKAELSGVKTSMTAFLANVTVRRTVMENSQELVVGQYQNGYSQMPTTQTVPTHKSTTTEETEQ